MSDTVTVKTYEYHRSTHTLTRQIDKEDIVEQFGDYQTFEDAFYDEEDARHEEAHDFVNEHDYERDEDTWTIYKGGYDVDYEIVEEE